MKRIPPVPPETSPKPDKLADRITRCNPKVHDEKFEPIELQEWIWKMEKIFVVFEVPEEKNVNIGIFYSASEVEYYKQ